MSFALAGGADPAETPGDRGRRRPARVSGDDRERAILGTAQRLLKDRPLHEISVDDLARGAGISRPTFYFYFESKDAVLLTLLDRMVRNARADRDEALARAVESGDPVAGWRAGIAAFHATWQANRELLRAAAEARASSPEVRELWERVMAELVGETAEGILAERQRGAAPPGPPARELAVCLTGMIERAFAGTFGGAGPALAEDDVVETLLDVFLCAIYRERVMALPRH